MGRPIPTVSPFANDVFAEGEVMEHGASAEGDVVVVFITNKPFRIDYVNQPGAQAAGS